MIPRSQLDVHNRLMERSHGSEHAEALNLLSQGGAILFNPKVLVLGFGSAVTQVTCQHQLSLLTPTIPAQPLE